MTDPKSWRPRADREAAFSAHFAQGPALGAWCDIPSLMTAEIIASAGFDFALIDLEHGPAGFETALGQLVAAERRGAVGIIRTPVAQEPFVKRALDIGAAGIMAPAVESAAQAAEIAALCRYGPQGRRGVATRIIRASDYGDDAEAYEARWNDRALLIAQIESPAALEAAAEIAAVEGVTALFFGPADFAAAAGYPGEAAVAAAYQRMLKAAHGAGAYAGTTPFGALSAADLVAGGADIVTVASDISLLRKGAAAALAAARGRADQAGGANSTKV